MSEAFQLNQNPGWVSLGSSGIRVRAPGLTGTLIWRAPIEHTQFTASLAAPRPVIDGPHDLVEQALKEAGLDDQGSLTIPTGAASLASPLNKIVLDRTVPRNRVEFAIYRDESGVISLHRPLPSPPTAAILEATRVVPQSMRVHYVIPLRGAATPTGRVPQMAMLGGIGGKVIRFVGRTVSGIVGDAVYAVAKLWEDHYRAAQGFHWGDTLTDLVDSAPVPLTDANWQTLQGNKSLLFVHGTISSTSGAFIGLQQFPTQAGSLYAKYGNRVVGFNHHTLTKSVPKNAVDFFSGIPAGNYQFDVISHSRGGLLTRALKELTPAGLGQLIDPVWTPPAGLNVQIDKVILAGTPNVGTPLANPTELPAAVSRLASIASTFSHDAAALGLGALFAIFGGIVEGGLGALPGLEDMNPGNPFLTQLYMESTNNSSYYAIQADFQPTGGLAQAIENDSVDALFLGEANDLIVPTLGVSEVNGQTLPGGQIDAYPQSANVYHLDYFYQQGTWDSILEFMPG
jgi:pimeloyl-ACP methyl ester carboxylesterase